jgi:tRNA A58 N-methylase Trm61
MPNHLLSFELSEDKDQLFVHADENGLRFLVDELNNLLAHTREGHFDHEHLMTPEWGGDELSSERQGGIILNHVKVYCWKGSEPQI